MCKYTCHCIGSDQPCLVTRLLDCHLDTSNDFRLFCFSFRMLLTSICAIYVDWVLCSLLLCFAEYSICSFEYWNNRYAKPIGYRKQLFIASFATCEICLLSIIVDCMCGGSDSLAYQQRSNGLSCWRVAQFYQIHVHKHAIFSWLYSFDLISTSAICTYWLANCSILLKYIWMNWNCWNVWDLKNRFFVFFASFLNLCYFNLSIFFSFFRIFLLF